MVERQAVPRISSSTSGFFLFPRSVSAESPEDDAAAAFSIVDDDESTSDLPPAA
jgi:hypothetical protein